MISSLGSYNKSTGLGNLFAVYGNDIVDVDTGLGFNQNLTFNQQGEFASYLDKCFYVNNKDASRSFDGAYWRTTGTRNRMPIGRYLCPVGTKLYLGDVTINGLTFNSRVWKTDNPYNNDARWGLEWGTNLVQTKGSQVVTADGAYFSEYGIKVADKLIIMDGANKGEYTVYSVDSNNQLTLTVALKSTVAASQYYVGSNYFDVKTNDNDYLRGLGENSNYLLAFKLNSLHRYNGTTLYEVKGAPGTSSNRSIVNIGSYTLYFHGSQATAKTGLYAYNGVDSQRVSSAIQPYIDGISASIFPDVVGWREGDWYRVYVGDISNPQRNISVTKAVISYDIVNEVLTVDPINKVIEAATTYLEGNQEKIFFADNDKEIFETPSGYSFDGDPIPFAIETGPKYPQGSESLNTFTRVQVISRDARGVGVRYKLYDTPYLIDDQWKPLGEITNDKTEFTIPAEHRYASGISLRFEETSIRENTPYIEKYSFFYLNHGTKTV